MDCLATGEKLITQKSVIKAKCLECCNFQKGEVIRCHIDSCPLWCFRLRGVKPKAGTPEYEKFLYLLNEQEKEKEQRRANLSDKQKENLKKWKTRNTR